MTNSTCWTISKAIDGISYGHRVYTQNLIEEYSEDTSCKCKWLHGHNAYIVIHFTSTKLQRGFVTDFKHANWIKTFLDRYIDHKFIIDRNDPWFNNIINGEIVKVDDINEALMIPRVNGSYRRVSMLPVCNARNEQIGSILDVDEPVSLTSDLFLTGPEREFYEGFFIVDFVPTSENLAKWVYDFVNVNMERIGVSVSKVEWSETPKTNAIYQI